MWSLLTFRVRFPICNFIDFVTEDDRLRRRGDGVREPTLSGDESLFRGGGRLIGERRRGLLERLLGLGERRRGLAKRGLGETFLGGGDRFLGGVTSLSSLDGLPLLGILGGGFFTGSSFFSGTFDFSSSRCNLAFSWTSSFDISFFGGGAASLSELSASRSYDNKTFDW